MADQLSSPSKSSGGTVEDEKTKKDATATDAEAPAEDVDDEFSLSLKKKKKKKAPKPTAAAETGAEPEVIADVKLPSTVPQETGVLAAGDSERDYNYTELMERVFALLREKNPQLAGQRKRHVMPPPQLVRVGTRKTMWANFNQIAQLMHRSPEHVMSFMLAELGTDGSIDGTQRLVLKGRFVPKQMESLLKKYIIEYVTCHMCRNPETSLTRDAVTRLYFLQCESCGSRRSVAPIKSGFHAVQKSDRRKAKEAL